MNLNDLSQYMGADLSASATGDLQSCTNSLRSQQRVLRRLLTNPGDYIFQLDYGAGLSKYIGQTTNIPEITALIRGQLFLEDSVGQLPEPIINVTPINGGITGGISVEILYSDAATGQPVNLNFSVNR